MLQKFLTNHWIYHSQKKENVGSENNLNNTG